MTGDAQAEAERIVARVAGGRVELGPVAALFTDKADAERLLNTDRDRLVAALAAAIDRDRESNVDGHIGCACPKCSLRDALFALRARAGEEYAGGCEHGWVEITKLDDPSRRWVCLECGEERWEPHDTEGTA